MLHSSPIILGLHQSKVGSPHSRLGHEISSLSCSTLKIGGLFLGWVYLLPHRPTIGLGFFPFINNLAIFG